MPSPSPEKGLTPPSVVTDAGIGGLGVGIGDEDEGLGAPLITPGVGGADCEKHHWRTNAA